jgi:hypothetical protein
MGIPRCPWGVPKNAVGSQVLVFWQSRLCLDDLALRPNNPSLHTLVVLCNLTADADLRIAAELFYEPTLGGWVFELFSLRPHRFNFALYN